MEEIPLVSLTPVQICPREREYHRRINKNWKVFQKIQRKPERIVCCDPRMLFSLCSDFHLATQSQWEQQWEDYERIDKISNDLWVKDDGKLLLWHRVNNSEEHTTYTVIHSASEDSFVGYQIMVLGPGRCYFSGNVSAERLDYIVSKVDQKHIYKPWACVHCHKESVPESLICTSCHQARYWKCECGTPQIFGVESCRKCGFKETLL